MHHATAFVTSILFALGLSGPVLSDNTPPPDPYAEILMDTLLPEDRTIDFQWEDALRERLAAVETEYPDEQNLDSIAQIRELIDRPRVKFDSRAELSGQWRVRSMQADDLGAYVYDWFPARIFTEAQALVFDKYSGSQRHRGLMAQIDEDRVFFAGALYYGYEEPRMYSGHMDQGAANADRDFDTTALIYKVGPDHFLMAFAPKDGRHRLYEIKK